MSHFTLDAFKIPSLSLDIVSLITAWLGVDFFALAFLQFVEFIGCTDYVSSNGEFFGYYISNILLLHSISLLLQRFPI